MQRPAFFPQTIYAQAGMDASTRVLVAPAKYIQGPGVLLKIADYLSQFGWRRVAVVASARGHATQAGLVCEQLGSGQIDCTRAIFGGECSVQEIDSHTAALSEQQLDGIIAVGGGKCVDAGKSIAYRLGLALIVVPTLASNDAPCSAVSVLYTPEGVAIGAEFFPLNPSMVIVDTDVVTQAPERYLVAGMGDAMATWYEAKVCMENPNARNVLGVRPTMTACAMGQLCADTLYADGLNASLAVQNRTPNEALEKVVEANTLLSGVGFESGGLAAAHGFAQGYTTLPDVERNFLHGEMVAMGVVGQLVLQDDLVEAQRVAEFFAQVGLPIHLGQLGLQPDPTHLSCVVDGVMAFDPINNLPFDVSHQMVADAMLGAHELGTKVARDTGDEAWRRLQN